LCWKEKWSDLCTDSVYTGGPETEGIAVVTASAVLHPISLAQRQQQNWLQPC